ncbi:hypothetical protein [Staphylococcus xylosus]|uniref:hypothetical protein n=1 Tax=Staphylococcus xylosus TaxID=1288 RepID=UPI001AACDE3B|nr:hypothetical protein [Staphylococcus xylosus]MBO3073287.1 hypothetical protein [Staphylococcus xylosus]
MGIAEQILDELKLLNKNLRVTNTEISTVDESVVQNIVKEVPMKKTEEPTIGHESTTEEQTLTKDDVMRLGKQFVQKADDSDKKAFKEKLEELGANKLSNVSEEHFSEIVDFMSARLSA